MGNMQFNQEIVAELARIVFGLSLVYIGYKIMIQEEK